MPPFPPALQTSIALDNASAVPIYRQLYQRIRDAIAGGLLKPGDRVTAARALAQELGVSRGTVDAAYMLLVAEGYVETRGQAGSVVAPGIGALAAHGDGPARGPDMGADMDSVRGARRVSEGHGAQAQAHADTAHTFSTSSLLPFQMGLPALDAFPRKTWARLAARAARAMQAQDMIMPPPAGTTALRTAVAAYLQVARGIRCAPEQVFITSGFRASLDLVVRALLQPGDTVWTEQPGYPPARELLRQAGMRLAPVPVDGDGVDVAHGVLHAPHARAAVVTPAHQAPLGMALALPRRLALLEWASASGAWIVEDDYDGEYRYASRPLPALQSLDRNGRVLYSGTFSKVLFPGIRLAYLVVPPGQVARFDATSRAFGSGNPQLTQDIVAGFMAEGHFSRHIQRMRRLYGERRALAAQGLSAALTPHWHVEDQPGGMHLVLRPGAGLAAAPGDGALAQRMRAAGMAAQALSEWTQGEDAVEDGADRAQGALLLGFTNIAGAAQAEALGRRILALL